MKINIYVNETNTFRYCDEIILPKVLTEKQYEEKALEMLNNRMKQENLRIEDGFDDWLSCDYTLSKIFFLTEEEKRNILEEFKRNALEDTFDELKNYYERFEIEI